MDLHWFFRNRFSRAPEFPDDQNFGNTSSDEMLKSSGFSKSFDDIEAVSKGMFRQMDEMLNQMFSSDFMNFGSNVYEDNFNNKTDPRSQMLRDPEQYSGPGDFFAESPGSFIDNGSNVYEDNFNNKTDPRSQMLRDPEQYSGPGDFFAVSPGSFIDNDIDDEVAKHGLMLDEARPNRKTATNFSQNFSSCTMIKLPDGTLEERKKVTDHLGNVTTTIRRSIGNQSYEITTHSNKQGIKEKEEVLKNLDENELPDFEKRWQTLKKKPDLVKPDSGTLVPTINPRIGDTSYSSIFKKFFGF